MAEDMFSSPTPFTPPTTEEDRLSWLRLIRSNRVGVATFYKLLEEHGTAQRALDALPHMARASGARDYTAFSERDALAEFERALAAGAAMLCAGAPGYPTSLLSLPDAPPVLWGIGDFEALSQPMVAVIGARSASSLGLRMARRLAGELAEAGFCIVSGLARGIDGVAHDAARRAAGGAGRTVGVHAGGVDIVYPAEHAELAEAITRNGCRLSEHPPGVVPTSRYFPMRNRLVSGLSHAVIVVEAAERSGSLITARFAVEQGREVLAVPGHPVDPRSAGGNALIRQGATLIRGVTDVMEALGNALPRQPVLRKRIAPQERRIPAPVAPATLRHPAARVAPAPDAPVDMDEVCIAILDLTGATPVAEDQLIRDLGIGAAAVGSALLMLELEGMMARQAGGLWARTDVTMAGAAPH